MKCNNCNNHIFKKKKIKLYHAMNNYMTLKKQQHFSPQMDFFFLERVGENMQAILNEKNLPQISFFHLELSLQQSFE